MARLADELLADIDKETVDFRDNYDGTTQEPTVPAGQTAAAAVKRPARYCRGYGHQHSAAQLGRAGGRRSLCL